MSSPEYEAIKAAIADVAIHPNPDLALGLAEGLAIAHFWSWKITPDEFKQFCAEIRDLSLARVGRKAA